MRKGRFSEEQIVTVLQEHQAGAAAAEMCRRILPGGESFRGLGTLGEPLTATGPILG